MPDKADWWANGNIICNEYKKGDNQWWGDHFILQLKDMFADTCKHRKIPDCDFFINKRDYPHLKYNEHISSGVPVEPYGFIFDRDDREPAQDVPLMRHNYRSYAPIMSFYSSDRFADIPIPPSEDWEAVTGGVFPSSFIHKRRAKGEQVDVGEPRDLFTVDNLRKFEKPWSEKIPTAFFRGTATGGGVTIETNQRLMLAQLSYEWGKNLQNYSATKNNEKYCFLDAKITGWNLRDKKIFSSKMTHLKQIDFPFKGSKSNYIPIYKQADFKYLIYAEGHCAACRYGFMMQLGSVILKVDSTCVADKMWYFPLLVPYNYSQNKEVTNEDHIPVKSDMSNLEEVRNNVHRSN